MGVRLAQFVFLVAAFAAPGCASMNPGKPASGACHVTGAQKLPTGISSDGICAAIAKAMAAEAPRAQYKVEIEVQSEAKLAASLVVNGRALPVQKMAVSDGRLGPGSIQRFAEALAGLVAKS